MAEMRRQEPCGQLRNTEQRLRETKPSGGCDEQSQVNKEMERWFLEEVTRMIHQQEAVVICPASAVMLQHVPVPMRSVLQMVSNKPSHDLLCLYAETHSVPEIILQRINAEQGTV